MDAGRNFAFKIAAKPLQIGTWLRLTSDNYDVLVIAVFNGTFADAIWRTV